MPGGSAPAVQVSGKYGVDCTCQAFAKHSEAYYECLKMLENPRSPQLWKKIMTWKMMIKRKK